MPSEKRQKKINKVVKKRQSGLVVVLEDIHDPHNAAAIFRSCDAFGVQEVYLIFEKEVSFSPKRVGKSSSSSANKWLDFKKFKSTRECLAELKQQGFDIAVTALDKSAKSIFKTNLKNKKLALVFGNEHRGASMTALEMADKKIMIPMSGMVQSLNVSVSAGIVLYEVARQRNNADKFFIAGSEQERLTEKFLNK